MEKSQNNNHKKEKNNEISEKIENLIDDIQEKTKKIREEINIKSEDIKKEFIENIEEIKEKTEEMLNNIKDNSKKFDKKDIEENKAMAAFSYIIPPVPYFIEDKSKWVRYHAIQGMNLFIIFIILSLGVSILNSLVLWIFPFLKVILRTILYTFIVTYALIGIINVCNGKAKELPFINKFKFIKK